MFVLTCYIQFSSRAKDTVAVGSTQWVRLIQKPVCCWMYQLSWTAQMMKQYHISAPWCVSLMFRSTWLSVLVSSFSRVLFWNVLHFALYVHVRASAAATESSYNRGSDSGSTFQYVWQALRQKMGSDPCYLELAASKTPAPGKRSHLEVWSALFREEVGQ